MFLAGPVIWSVHFMLVYLVAEAGCTGDGPGLRVFDPPVPTVVTLAATAVAAAAALGCARWAYRRWRMSTAGPATGEGAEPSGGGAGDRSDDLHLQDRHPGASVAFAGFLPSSLAVVTILLVGLPALVLPSC